MLANVLSILGPKIRCVVLCPQGDAQDQFRALGVQVLSPEFPIRQFTHISGFNRPALHPGFIRDLAGIRHTSRHLARLIAKLSPRIVHYNAVTLAPYIQLARRQRSKAVAMVQETPIRGFCGLRTAWLKRMLAKADATLFISNFDKVAWGHGSSQTANVLPNWVDLREFHLHHHTANIRRNLGIPLSATVCLFLGGVSELKGTLTAVRAVEEASKYRDIYLILAGYSAAALTNPSPKTYAGSVQSAMARLGTRVACVGCVSDVVSLYTACDIVLFPAAKPHQSRPMIEAGAMGKPVVISCFPQLDEFCAHGINCLRVDPLDPNSFARAIVDLTDDQDLVRRLTDANLRSVRERHSADAAASILVPLYEGLL